MLWALEIRDPLFDLCRNLYMERQVFSIGFFCRNKKSGEGTSPLFQNGYKNLEAFGIGCEIARHAVGVGARVFAGQQVGELQLVVDAEPVLADMGGARGALAVGCLLVGWWRRWLRRGGWVNGCMDGWMHVRTWAFGCLVC